MLAEQRTRAVAAIKALALHQAVAYANPDGAVLPATVNAPVVFPNLVTIVEYAHRSATAVVSKDIFHSTADSNAKVALEIHVTDMACALLMARVTAVLNTGGVHAN